MSLLNVSKFLYLFGLVLLTGLQQIPSTNGANILGIFTSHSPSHFIVHMSVIKALAEAGHNVTVVSSQKPKVTHPSIKHIIIPPTKEQEDALNQGMNQMTAKKGNLVTMIGHMFTSMSSMITMQYDMLLDEKFTKLYDSKFDLLFMGYFINDYQVGLAKKFNCPIIMNWMGPPAAMINAYVGNPEEISYVPNMNVAVKTGERMGFVKRVQNFVSAGIFGVFSLVIDHHMGTFYDKLFANEPNFPSLNEMKKNVSLIFCNSHFSEGPVRPNVPAIVEIGGIQIKNKPDPLPKDIAEFLDSAKQDGAILFSLGSNLKGENIKPETVLTIFKTLASLKQKVIWKWDDLENLPGKSSNILYKKWLPQDDILAHPNLRLFITHAGKGGVAEAQYHAVPMVALPVFADQPSNAEKITISGYGKHLDIYELTEKEFKETILEVIQNPKYKQNVKKFSDLYRDRPLSAKQSVVYWTEYILRYHGAQHLQSPLVHLNFFQKLSVDVIAFLLLVIFIVGKIFKIIIKFLISKCKSKNKSSTKKLKKN